MYVYDMVINGEGGRILTIKVAAHGHMCNLMVLFKNSFVLS